MLRIGAAFPLGLKDDGAARAARVRNGPSGRPSDPMHFIFGSDRSNSGSIRRFRWFRLFRAFCVVVVRPPGRPSASSAVNALTKCINAEVAEERRGRPDGEGSGCHAASCRPKASACGGRGRSRAPRSARGRIRLIRRSVLVRTSQRSRLDRPERLLLVERRASPGGGKKRAPRKSTGLVHKNWNGEGFLKPSRNNEALTTPFSFPRTGGMPSV